LVLKQQAILAIGMDGHCCTRLKENDTADKGPRANRAFKNGLFLANLGTKMITLFAVYIIIGT
jgi:hypothetical protein